MKKNLKLIIAIVVLLVIISAVIPIFATVSVLESFRIVFGCVYVLFIPGLIISYIFFPYTKKSEDPSQKGSIDLLERIALSFALSIAIIPLLLFYFNLIGIKISFLNSFLVISGIILVSSGILFFMRPKKYF